MGYCYGLYAPTHILKNKPSISCPRFRKPHLSHDISAIITCIVSTHELNIIIKSAHQPYQIGFAWDVCWRFGDKAISQDPFQGQASICKWFWHIVNIGLLIVPFTLNPWSNDVLFAIMMLYPKDNERLLL